MRVRLGNEAAEVNYSVYAAASKNVIYIMRMDEDFSEISVIQYFNLYEGDIKLFSISLNQELFTVCGNTDGDGPKFISCRPLTQPSQPTTTILRP